MRPRPLPSCYQFCTGLHGLVIWHVSCVPYEPSGPRGPVPLVRVSSSQVDAASNPNTTRARSAYVGQSVVRPFGRAGGVQLSSAREAIWRRRCTREVAPRHAAPPRPALPSAHASAPTDGRAEGYAERRWASKVGRIRDVRHGPSGGLANSEYHGANAPSGFEFTTHQRQADSGGAGQDRNPVAIGRPRDDASAGRARADATGQRAPREVRGRRGGRGGGNCCTPRERAKPDVVEDGHKVADRPPGTARSRTQRTHLRGHLHRTQMSSARRAARSGLLDSAMSPAQDWPITKGGLGRALPRGLTSTSARASTPDWCAKDFRRHLRFETTAAASDACVPACSAHLGFPVSPAREAARRAEQSSRDRATFLRAPARPIASRNKGSHRHHIGGGGIQCREDKKCVQIYEHLAAS